MLKNLVKLSNNVLLLFDLRFLIVDGLSDFGDGLVQLIELFGQRIQDLIVLLVLYDVQILAREVSSQLGLDLLNAFFDLQDLAEPGLVVD